MVSMQMGDKNVIYFKVFDFKSPELVLGGFTAIKQKAVFSPGNHL